MGRAGALEYLLLVYASANTINIVVVYLLWRSSRISYFRTLLIPWIGGILTLLATALTSEGSLFARLAAFSVLFIFYGGMAGLLAQMVRLRFRVWPYLAASIVALIYAFVVDRQALPPASGAFLIALTTGLPAIVIGVRALSTRWAEMSVALRGFSVTLLLDGLHALSFAHGYDKPEMAAFGFGLGLTFAIAFSLFGPGAILERVAGERARLETEVAYKAGLLHAAKLSALGEMAGGMAHEVNTPLAILMTLSGQMKEVLADKTVDVPLLREMAVSIEGGVERISRIIVGLRAFSRDVSGDPLEQGDLRTIVSDTLNLCREKMKEEGVALVVRQPDSAMLVRCRAVEISQLLLNLLSNARDAVVSSPRKEIEIRIEEAGKGRIRVSVTDSGPGIQAEKRDKLFQPFYTTKEIGKGTGLGLSVAKGIAGGHGGTLELDESRKDTTFVLELPAG